MKVLDALKANKEPVLMMLGTAGVVADVILSIRNGVRMKRKLEELDQVKDDITNIDIVVECAPELIEIFGLTAVSLGCFWFARKINIDRIISLGSVAAMYQQRLENQEKVFKSELDDDVYVELEEKVTAENTKAAVKKVKKPEDVIDHNCGDTRLCNEFTGHTHKWSIVAMNDRFNKWKKDMTSDVCNWNPRDDEWVPVSSLYETYFKEPENNALKNLGWRITDIRNIRLETSNPPLEVDELDEPVIPFKVSILPKTMPMRCLE
jgi:hypothetical protein